MKIGFISIKQRLGLTLIFGGMCLLPVLAAMVLDHCPFDTLPELHEAFAIGILMAHANLLAVWLDFARMSLLARVCSVPLALNAMFLAWLWLQGFGRYETQLSVAFVATVVALVALSVPAANSIAFARAVILAIASWFSLSGVFLSGGDLRDVVVCSCILIFFTAILTLPMFLLKSYQPWRIATADDVPEPEPSRGQTFSLAQLMGWMTVIAIVVGVCTQAAARSPRRFKFSDVNLGEWLESVLFVSPPTIYVAIAGTVLVLFTLGKPRWSLAKRTLALVGLIVLGVIPSPFLAKITRFPLAGMIPVLTYLFVFIAYLIALRRLGFYLPRR